MLFAVVVMAFFVCGPDPVAEFGSQAECQAEADRFVAECGFDFLSLIFGFSEAEARAAYPQWVVEWAIYLDRWDCWLFEPEALEEYLALEELELAHGG